MNAVFLRKNRYRKSLEIYGKYILRLKKNILCHLYLPNLNLFSHHCSSFLLFINIPIGIFSFLLFFFIPLSIFTVMIISLTLFHANIVYHLTFFRSLFCWGLPVECKQNWPIYEYKMGWLALTDPMVGGLLRTFQKHIT